MYRVNGFINLDEMIKNNEIIKNEKNNINDLDSFIYNNTIYFFKPAPDGLLYNELIAEELLKDLNIECAEYDLAIFNGIEGNLTKNYRIENVDYVNGQVILENYLDHLQDKYPDEDNYYDYCINNLNDLWNAFDFRYQNRVNKLEIVSKLMYKIVSLFIFDLLIKNTDRTECNFEIMECGDFVDLAPVYDNQNMLFDKNNTSLVVDRDTKFIGNVELEKFINTTKSSYIEEIKEKLWVINDVNILKVFNRIEDKIKYKIDESIKRNYIEKFKKVNDEILNVLQNKKVR